MNHQDLPFESVSPPLSAIDELSGAQDDLARLSALLKAAFGELLTSFSAIQSVARKTGSSPEMDRFTSRAITALQSEDLASQLIGHTRKRLALAEKSLKIRPQMPQIAATSPVWAAGIAPGPDRAGAAPVQQAAMSAGTIELF
jgi:hypothetical protein